MPDPTYQSTGGAYAWANGDWVLAGTYNTYDYFTGSNGGYLWRGAAGGAWHISEALGSVIPGAYDGPVAASPAGAYVAVGFYYGDAALLSRNNWSTVLANDGLTCYEYGQYEVYMGY